MAALIKNTSFSLTGGLFQSCRMSEESSQSRSEFLSAAISQYPHYGKVFSYCPI